MNENNTLRHYGVLGMKWGVRKDRLKASMGRAKEQKERKKAREEREKLREESRKERQAQKRTESEKKHVSKNRGTLTDDEIRAKINRLRLEKELRELTEAEVSPGKKFAKEVLRESGKQALTQVSRNTMLYAGKSFVGDVLGQKEFANTVFGNNGTKKEEKKEEKSESKTDSGSPSTDLPALGSTRRKKKKK